MYISSRLPKLIGVHPRPSAVNFLLFSPVESRINFLIAAIAQTKQGLCQIIFLLKSEFADKILPQIETKSRKYALNIKLISHNGFDLDIVPFFSVQGQTTEFLRQR
ncbi:hypothetical protein H6G74_23550 [Nostoc spongiaeforme FACHB-130]|uniref:Sucrose phosphatase-like domain-containing protein n=1 Tax=Nostoc spongiaeforme FACHB-130 TaxID=1357510 RepID=A0ABR8G256_9NOSO|nr:hypothetical protein [Nostoc spongiaeforme FACHB-130]